MLLLKSHAAPERCSAGERRPIGHGHLDAQRRPRRPLGGVGPCRAGERGAARPIGVGLREERVDRATQDVTAFTARGRAAAARESEEVRTGRALAMIRRTTTPAANTERAIG